MSKPKNKTLKKTDPMLAVGGILNGALENLTDAGIEYTLGWNDEGLPVIIFTEGVHLCANCGKFSVGTSCKQSKCTAWGEEIAAHYHGKTPEDLVHLDEDMPTIKDTLDGITDAFGVPEDKLKPDASTMPPVLADLMARRDEDIQGDDDG